MDSKLIAPYIGTIRNVLRQFPDVTDPPTRIFHAPVLQNYYSLEGKQIIEVYNILQPQHNCLGKVSLEYGLGS